MEELQIIVARLNEAPFNMSLRMVDLDSKSPIDLLQILNDVFVSIDPKTKTTDTRLESEESRAIRMTDFLLVLKCKQVPADEDDRRIWMDNLGKGKKAVVFPLLRWCLSMHERLKKRAYLSTFLLPVDLPIELTMQGDSALTELAARYRSLQEEFKDVHKHHDALGDAAAQPSTELRREIKQLELEKSQLEDRIELLQNKSKGESSGFAAIFDVTSALRKEQDEEVRLQQSMRDQTQSLSLVEAKLKQVQHWTVALRSKLAGDNSADSILSELQREVNQMTVALRSDMLIELETKLSELERERLEPMRTEEDLDSIRDTVDAMEGEYLSKKEELETACARSANNKIAMFQQHANVATAKLKAKETEFASKEKELLALKTAVKELELKAGEVASSSGQGIVGPDGKPMSRDDFRAFGVMLREKSQRYKDAQQDLSEMNAETHVLRRTEQILKGRVENVDQFLKDQEDRAGVSGFRDARSKLELASEETAELNEMKGETLEEISAVVKKITDTLARKKEVLKPQIEMLKEARTKFRSLERRHEDKKSRYEQMSSKFAADRQVTESECNRLQEQWLQTERNYHELRSLNEIVRSDLEKVRMEEEWRKGGDGDGDGDKFLPEFQSLQELYENKLVQQEGLAKQLRKEQRHIRENEAEATSQRAMFLDLKRLLEMKQRTKRMELAKAEAVDAVDGMNEPFDVGTAQILSF